MLASVPKHRPHYHPCANQALGCTWSLTCYGAPDEDSACSETQVEGWECDDCQESRCGDCGCVVRLEGHDRRSSCHPDYDPTPWELPSDGASVGPETRAAAAWQHKRGPK